LTYLCLWNTIPTHHRSFLHLHLLSTDFLRNTCRPKSSTKDNKIEIKVRISDDYELPVWAPVMRRQDVEVGSRTGLTCLYEVSLGEVLEQLNTLLHFPLAETKTPVLKILLLGQRKDEEQPSLVTTNSVTEENNEQIWHQEEKPHVVTQCV
jgi:hypothetical protein